MEERGFGLRWALLLGLMPIAFGVLLPLGDTTSPESEKDKRLQISKLDPPTAISTTRQLRTVLSPSIVTLSASGGLPLDALLFSDFPPDLLSSTPPLMLLAHPRRRPLRQGSAAVFASANGDNKGREEISAYYERG